VKGSISVPASAIMLAAVTVLQGCRKPPEFFLLPQFAQEGGCTDPARPQVSGYRREPVIISNPPSDKQALKRAVDAYNRQTLPENILTAMCNYKRKFYRETDYTPRNYVEGNHGFLEHDQFEDHEKDMILTVRWQGGHDSAVYEFYEDGKLVE
jgi:hypothetical protein